MDLKPPVVKFYFVQLPLGNWTIAKQLENGDWLLADGNNNKTKTEYFIAIGDEIPLPS